MSRPERDYSAVPVAHKLGIAPQHSVLIANVPTDVDLGIPPAVTVHRRAKSSSYDVIVLFAPQQSVLLASLAPATRRLASAGGLWVAWPKRSSGVRTDLSESIVLEIGLATGLVDNKVCSINGVWSALRFVRRLKDRAR